MKKDEFLNELRRALASLGEEDRRDAIDFYDDYISDSEDEEAAIDGLGSPAQVAKDIISDYTSQKNWETGQGERQNKNLPIKREETAKNQERGTERPIGFYMILAVVAVCVGVPILKVAGYAGSSVLTAVILILIAFVIIKLLKKNDAPKESVNADFQTCSDIRSLDIRLGSGMYVIEQGESFLMNGAGLKSSISGGVWRISGNVTDNISNTKIITITIPKYFTAQNARIKLGAGNLLIKGLSAYEMGLEVSVGNMEASGLYAKKLDIKCGVGRMKAGASMDGNVNISCGMGEASLRLTNRSEEFKQRALIGLGKVSLGGQEISGSGKAYYKDGAPYNMDIKCGMGNVRIDFGGVI